MKKILFITIMMSSTLAMGSTGEILLKESCSACHGTEMYTRDSSKITNAFDLRRQISYCRNNLNVDWFPEDERLVVNYLNRNFYHFKDDKQ